MEEHLVQQRNENQIGSKLVPKSMARTKSFSFPFIRFHLEMWMCAFGFGQKPESFS